MLSSLHCIWTVLIRLVLEGKHSARKLSLTSWTFCYRFRGYCNVDVTDSLMCVFTILYIYIYIVFIISLRDPTTMDIEHVTIISY
jgi:hypothetical protein